LITENELPKLNPTSLTWGVTNYKKMKLKLNILLTGIILIALFSFKNKPKQLTPKYLVGKWTYYLGNSIKNGIVNNDTVFSKPFKYEFKKNKDLFFENDEFGKWVITKEKKLILNNVLHEVIIESNSKMRLNNESYSYHFKKGWSE